MSEVPPPPHRRRAHTSTRDLERYAGLFAERTRVMRSSAMRDLMAITARPEVISLAGGLPDTSTFPPKSFAAQMTRIAQESAAEALQYGPTEGFEETKDCILEVMGAEGMLLDPDDVIVTTGGQQAIDLVCKTLVDPGDVVICEAPTYPGAVPVFCSYQAEVIQVECDEDGMRIDVLEQLLERLRRRGAAAEVHLLGADLPEPGRGDDVARRGASDWSSWRACTSCSSSRTTPTGCCATAASRCRRSTSSTAATSSSTSAPSRRSSPPASASAGRWRRRR